MVNIFAAAHAHEVTLEIARTSVGGRLRNKRAYALQVGSQVQSVKLLAGVAAVLCRRD